MGLGVHGPEWPTQLSPSKPAFTRSRPPQPHSPPYRAPISLIFLRSGHSMWSVTHCEVTHGVRDCVFIWVTSPAKKVLRQAIPSACLQNETLAGVLRTCSRQLPSDAECCRVVKRPYSESFLKSNSPRQLSAATEKIQEKRASAWNTV